MITVAQYVKEIIKDSSFLEEGLALGIINLTGLARKLKSEIESKSLKKTSIGAIVMSLQRLGVSLKKKSSARSKLLFPQDIIVKSNLMELTYANSPNLRQKLQKIFLLAQKTPNVFFNLLQGIFETSIIASRQLMVEFNVLLKPERLIFKIDNLASITLRFEQAAMFAPGVYYLVLKQLAWEGINVVEVASINNELSIIVEQKKVDKAFSVIKSLLEK
jgi:hypothetical protein